jgi:hypothetical protein
MELYQNKKFLYSKVWGATEWEKVFTNYKSNKGLRKVKTQ